MARKNHSGYRSHGHHHTNAIKTYKHIKIQINYDKKSHPRWQFLLTLFFLLALCILLSPLSFIDLTSSPSFLCFILLLSLVFCHLHSPTIRLKIPPNGIPYSKRIVMYRYHFFCRNRYRYRMSMPISI